MPFKDGFVEGGRGEWRCSTLIKMHFPSFLIIQRVSSLLYFYVIQGMFNISDMLRKHRRYHPSNILLLSGTLLFTVYQTQTGVRYTRPTQEHSVPYLDTVYQTQTGVQYTRPRQEYSIPDLDRCTVYQTKTGAQQTRPRQKHSIPDLERSTVYQTQTEADIPDLDRSTVYQTQTGAQCTRTTLETKVLELDKVYQNQTHTRTRPEQTIPDGKIRTLNLTTTELSMHYVFSTALHSRYGGAVYLSSINFIRQIHIKLYTKGGEIKNPQGGGIKFTSEIICRWSFLFVISFKKML